MLRRLFGLFFVVAGVLHFVKPRMYERIMPPYVPAHREMVYASGAAEIAGGLATLHPATRRAGSALSIATLIAVFPANVHMALNADDYKDVPEAALWARLPVQALLIAWASAAGDWDV
ncbi:MAG: DoxX family protein [Solirubrobacterales bacterium]